MDARIRAGHLDAKAQHHEAGPAAHRVGSVGLASCDAIDAQFLIRLKAPALRETDDQRQSLGNQGSELQKDL